MNKIIEFDYVDAKGKESHRVLWTLSSPSDKYFGLDLSEFSEEERVYLVGNLEDSYAVFMEDVRQLGLGHNYRLFKEEGVSNLEKIT